MAEQQAGSAGTPIGKWSTPEPPAAPGGLQNGFAGSWMLLFGPPWRAGGPPRTMWAPGSRLVFNDGAPAEAGASEAGPLAPPPAKAGFRQPSAAPAAAA
eukprot:11964158-Alexandrium_andersonii.AAC.1